MFGQVWQIWIYKNNAQPSASRAACQPINSCAAHDSWQMLMLEGKTCSLRRAFTNRFSCPRIEQVMWALSTWSVRTRVGPGRHELPCGGQVDQQLASQMFDGRGNHGAVLRSWRAKSSILSILR